MLRTKKVNKFYRGEKEESNKRGGQLNNIQIKSSCNIPGACNCSILSDNNNKYSDSIIYNSEKIDKCKI